MLENAVTLYAGMPAQRSADYRGPERRSDSPLLARLLTLMLDEIDVGMLLLAEGGELVHANHAARAEIGAGHPLVIDGRRLRTRHAHDAARLQDALASASQRGLRRLLALGQGDERANVAVIPMPARAVIVSLGRRRLSQRLSLQCYAALHDLTPAETRVLEGLCEGLDPRVIAELNEVGLATVRTQIGSIRTKTRAGNIRALVRQLAVLPPMMSTLRN